MPLSEPMSQGQNNKDLEYLNNIITECDITENIDTCARGIRV